MQHFRFRWNLLDVLPIALAITHLLLCAITELGNTGNEGSWTWFLVIMLDLPSSALAYPLLKVFPAAFALGIVGTLWLYFIGSLPRAAKHRRITRFGSGLAAVIAGAAGAFGLWMASSNIAAGNASPMILCVTALGAEAILACAFLAILTLGIGRATTENTN